MTAVAELITVPGVYDMPEDMYHADPVAGGSLSSSGARLILKAPAHFRWAQDHPEEPKKVYDLGSAAHMLALGAGPQITVVAADSWRTNAAKEAAADAREAGRIPLLEKDAAEVLDQVAALRAHPIAGPMLAPGTGQPEQTLIWPDDHTGVWCRSRLDWLPIADHGTGRLIIPEYKTARSANPADLARPAHEYGYHVQAWWYQQAARALGLSPAPIVLFIFQEKTAPYLVSVVQPSDTFLNLGGLLARRAMGIYRDCVASGEWPGYTADVEFLTLPGWVENQWGDQIR